MRIAVCDDNNAELKVLNKSITNAFSKFTDEFNVMVFSDGIVLLNEHKKEPFDIVFLDIDMPVISGFDIAKSLRDDFSNCYIIFVTSHSELVYESMNFQPFNFIRKNCSTPIDESVSDIVSKLMQHMKQNEKIILEDYNYRKHSVLIRNIIYIESDGHYVVFYALSDGFPIRIRGSITEYEEKYSKYDFARIHKKYLINLRYLSQLNYNNNEIVLGIINKSLPLSKRIKKEVKEKYIIYLRSKS